MNLCKLCRGTLPLVPPDVYSILFRTLHSSTVYKNRFNRRNNLRETSHISNTVANPGIDRRMKIMKQVTPDIKSRNDLFDEDFEEMEGDFMRARDMEDYHTRTAERLRHFTEQKITERKHFKAEVQPNMLMSSEKEQIRLLHSQDPVVWNAEKLSESFPATPEIIKKVISSTWKPDSKDRLMRHDKKVLFNWNEFSEGRLNITCPQLKAHLKKFSKRTLLPDYSDVSIQLEKQLPKPQKTEFADIIHSYKSLNGISSKEGQFTKQKQIRAGKSMTPHDDLDVNSLEKSSSVIVATNEEVYQEGSVAQNRPILVSNKSLYTLDKLRNVMRKKQQTLEIEDINVQDRELLKRQESSEEVISNNTEMDEQKFRNDVQNSLEVQNKLIPKSRNRFELSNFSPNNSAISTYIKMRIHIPKNKVKVGYLYKVNDCFYSHDGFFLYRVPGMLSE